LAAVKHRFLLLIAFAVLLGATSARAANDPHLLWRTIETKHFRITFYSGEEEVARHVASLAEAILERLSPVVGWTPSEKTEVVLADQTDAANGSATALPYNAIHLNVTAPDDLSPLGDVDDWYQELVTHEFTHILHTDHIGGIPALVNRVLGKTLAPNQTEQRWVLEGLAVLEESTYTSGGRLRSSMWNMWMRADVLENNVATLDVFSNTPRRFPQGNIWYLYGSFFLQWVVETYGEDAIRRMIDDYGSQLIPYGLNRSIRRATGRTFEELYPAWVDTMKRNYGAEAQAIRDRGLREGVQLTHTGQTVQHVRWIPKNTWPELAGGLAYFVDDAHTRPGIYGLPIARNDRGDVTGTDERSRELLARTNGTATPSFAPDGTMVFCSEDISNHLFLFYDLFSLGQGKRSESGLEGARVRLTEGFRAYDPDVSPDGLRVVFTTNHRGTTYLQIADLVSEGTDAIGGLGNVHVLVPSAEFDQAFSPRWSPDNRHIAYSSWTKGGYRDVRLVDTKDGSFVQVTLDRAIDGGPSFSPDGKWLFYNSDRTGVMNVYAWRVEPSPDGTHVLKQVTNVINGAYQPEVSPDGKTLAYVGFTHEGFDVFAMHLDESEWLDPLPYVETRPSPPPEPPLVLEPAKPYNALVTLMPRHYSVQVTQGNFGQASIVSVTGADIAGLHSVAASITTEWQRPEFQGDLQYVYGRLPFDVSAHVFRNIQPGGGFATASNSIAWIEESVGLETGISYSMPRAFDGQNVALSYAAQRIGGDLAIPASQLNPYDTPSYPTRGYMGSLHMAWSYSNAESYLWSVGAERGFSTSATFDVSDPVLGGEYTGYAATGAISAYLLMPWARHHSLALHAGAGASGGNLGGRGIFYVGGFLDLPFIDTVRNVLIQSGIALRGYPVVAEVGHYYGLMNAEYRFPIVNVDRGLSTLPVFLNRINGAFFVDYGSAFDNAYYAEFKTGVGGEAWFDFTLGYIVDFTFRLGYAKGLASGGVDKTYFVATIPF
jgi:WD40-like Beta Propeller Repeat